MPTLNQLAEGLKLASNLNIVSRELGYFCKNEVFETVARVLQGSEEDLRPHIDRCLSPSPKEQ
jgi:hypothetical protein